MDYSKIGNRLKLVRERKGLSYEQIFEITRIQPSILEGIEEGKATVSPVFFKGFIKNYARSLGIDPEEMFKEAQREDQEAKEEIQTTGKKNGNKSVQEQKNNLKYFFPVLGLLIVFQLIWFLKIPKKSKESAKALMEKPAEGQEKSQTPDFPAEMKRKAGNETTEVTSIETADASEPFLSTDTPEGGLTKKTSTLFDQIKRSEFKKDLLIQSSEPLEIYFKVDRQSTITKNLKPSAWFHIKAKRSIYLRFDDRQGHVQIFYNGKQVNLGNKPFFEKTFQ